MNASLPSVNTSQVVTPSTLVSDSVDVIDSSKPKERKFRVTLLLVFIALWLVIVVVAGSILVLCMFGWILSDDRPKQRIYFEVTSQILNAMFTLSCILTHPGRCIDLVRFIRLKRSFASCFASGDFSRLASTKGFTELSTKYTFLGFSLPIDAFYYNLKLDKVPFSHQD